MCFWHFEGTRACYYLKGMDSIGMGTGMVFGISRGVQGRLEYRHGIYGSCSLHFWIVFFSGLLCLYLMNIQFLFRRMESFAVLFLGLPLPTQRIQGTTTDCRDLLQLIKSKGIPKMPRFHIRHISKPIQDSLLISRMTRRISSTITHPHRKIHDPSQHDNSCVANK